MANISDFKANLIAGVRPNLFKMEIQGLNEKFKFMCKASQVPGKTINPIEVSYLNMKHKVAGDAVFENLIVTATMDTDLVIRNSIESWMEDIRNSDASTGVSIAEYERTGNLILIDPVSGGDLATYEFTGIWPSNLGPVELAFESNDQIAEYTIEFAYTHWTQV